MHDGHLRVSSSVLVLGFTLSSPTSSVPDSSLSSDSSTVLRGNSHWTGRCKVVDRRLLPATLSVAPRISPSFS